MEPVETQLLSVAHVVRSSPLRYDPVTGDLIPGLCRDWRADRTGRVWALDCSHVKAVARQLTTVPGVRSVSSRARTITVRLQEPDRRFPYALTTARSTIPWQNAPGPFRIVSWSGDRLVVRRGQLTVIFRWMEAHAALRAFRRGELDEAPVPQGEIRAIEADPSLRPALRARPLLGLDLIELPRQLPAEVRSVYRLTAPRADYQILVNERIAPPAYALRPGVAAFSRSAVRAARGTIRSLLRIPLRVVVLDRPEHVEAAELVWAEWRQLGLPVELETRPARGLPPFARDKTLEAHFSRVIADYPRPEGLQSALGDLDASRAVPLAWVVKARLVSPRARGWRMDELGRVDYSRVTLEPGP